MCMVAVCWPLLWPLTLGAQRAWQGSGPAQEPTGLTLSILESSSAWPEILCTDVRCWEKATVKCETLTILYKICPFSQHQTEPMSIALCLWMQSWRLGRQKITFSASVCQAYLKRQDHCSFLQVMVVVGQEVTWNENILSDCHYWKSFTGKCPSKASFGPWNKLVSNFINLYRAPPAATRTQGTWGWKLSFTCDTEQWAEGWMEDQMLKAEKYEVGFGLEKSGLDFKRWYHSVWLGKHATLNKNRKTSLRKHTLFKYLEHFCWQPVNTNKLVQQCFQIFNRFFMQLWSRGTEARRRMLNITILIVEKIWYFQPTYMPASEKSC